MGHNSFVSAVIEKHPELENLPPRHLRLVKTAIREAVVLSQRDVLGVNKARELFRNLVPDVGKPSAALRAYRKRLSMSQRVLARRSGIPQPHISSMEAGQRSIGPTSAKKLAKPLGIDYRKLL